MTFVCAGTRTIVDKSAKVNAPRISAVAREIQIYSSMLCNNKKETQKSGIIYGNRSKNMIYNYYVDYSLWLIEWQFIFSFVKIVNASFYHALVKIINICDWFYSLSLFTGYPKCNYKF